LLCILQKTNGEVKLGFNGDLYAQASAGATTEIVEALSTESYTCTETSLTDIPELTLTKPDITNGKCINSFSLLCSNSISMIVKQVNMLDNDVVVAGGEEEQYGNTAKSLAAGVSVSNADGHTLKLQCRTGAGGTVTIQFNADQNISLLSCLGVG